MRDEKPRRLTPFLVVRTGGGPDEVVLWDTVEITCGRLAGQDIEIDDPEVSRRHCVFRHKDGEFSVEDLGSALGTEVNGEPAKLHPLQPGDVITVGSVKIKFGRTERAVKPGGNVRFASQLKGFGPEADAGAEAGGRTMMAIDLEDDLLSKSAPTLARAEPRARAVSLDGTLEDAEGSDLLGDDDLGLGEAPVRDLDASLAEDSDLWSAPDAEERTPASPPLAPVQGANTVVTLSVEVSGPADQVEALVEAVRDRAIEIAPLRLRVRAPRRG